jgi:hypothetical protein
MKLAINTCFGGFGLSDAGMTRYLEIKGIKTFPEKGHYDTIHWLDVGQTNCISHYDMERSDPALIQVLEEMGSAAWGDHSQIEILDIPAGTRYRIQEYDGNEALICEVEQKWETAT